MVENTVLLTFPTSNFVPASIWPETAVNPMGSTAGLHERHQLGCTLTQISIKNEDSNLKKFMGAVIRRLQHTLLKGLLEKGFPHPLISRQILFLDGLNAISC